MYYETCQYKQLTIAIILVDALYSTPPCVRYTDSFYSNCQEHDWSFKNAQGNIQITGSIVENFLTIFRKKRLCHIPKR